MYATVARPSYDPCLPPTPSQVRFIESLIASRQFDTDGGNNAEAALAASEAIEHLTKRTASEMIDRLKRLPVRPATPAATAAPAATVGPLEPGVYEMGGRVYALKKSRSSGHLYAMVLTPISGARLTGDDGEIRAEYVYAPGAIRDLRLEHRLTPERAEALSVQHGICIVCGRHLKAADSVRAGIGPVCRKRLA